MGQLTVIGNTGGGQRIALPAIIAGAGKGARKRFLDFFTVNIRNPNTRAAYGRAAAAFLRWCDARGIGALDQVEPVHVAEYIEGLGKRMKPPSVKQHLACIRMLFDWLVTGQVVPVNPAHSVRGPRHSVSKGTPVLSSEEATALLAGMNVSSVVGLRDRRDYRGDDLHLRPRGRGRGAQRRGLLCPEKRWWLRLNEKNGKVHEMPCHHKLEAYLDAYIARAGIAGDGKEPLFRVAIRKTKKLGPGRMTRKDVWYMVRRRASDAGIETRIRCHTFRATGITDYLTNGGRIEVAQRMAGHANAKTTGLYDRRNDDISVGEVEKIGI